MAAVSIVLLLPVAAMALDAPVTAVTVFSDRARVTRSATVSLSGSERIELPLLPDSVDPTTIRVDAEGAALRRVDIAHVEGEEFPRDEAREVLDKLEKLDDELAGARGERDTVTALYDAVQRLVPAVPTGEPLRPVPRLTAAGWVGVFAFAESWSEKLQARTRQLDERLVDLGRQRGQLAEKARILGGARRRSGYRVLPTLDGRGKSKVTVSYLVGNARWYPTYDIQLWPEKKQVQLTFAGLVSQESGEDWTDANLTLSTAVPATSTEYPKIYTWKIGERERFIPTPSPVVESAQPAPAAPPLPRAAEREDEVLRTRLLGRIGGAGVGSGRGGRFDRSKTDASGGEVEEDRDGERDYKKEAPVMPEQPQPPPPPPQEKMVPASAPAPVMADEMARPMAAPSRASWWRRSRSVETVASTPTMQAVPTEQVGLAPPPGYQPPSYAPDLPVSLAGGYDLAFPSVRAETVRTGKGARRVALLSESWPVAVERRVFPALVGEAFLVAEIKNPSSRALPGGHADLFVGADPAGVATLKLVAPRETFVLPLGLDRGIRPVRNVKLVTVEKGLISKDEINEYVVTIEIANPYATPLATRVIDQWPKTSDKNVELKLLRTDPPATEDKDKGSLEWRLTVPAAGKSVVSFTYSLRRPKNWRLHQN